MQSIILQCYKHFNRSCEIEYDLLNLNWSIIQKELKRVNIKSLLVSMPLTENSDLIFPLIVKSNSNYELVYRLTNKGLITKKGIIAFEDFKNKYNSEFLLLEKAQYINNDRPLYKSLITNKLLLTCILIVSALFIILTNSSKVSLLPSIGGLLLCLHTILNEHNGKIDSPFCVGKGIFTCKKNSTYDFGGLSLQSLGFIYFCGSLSTLLENEVTKLYYLISLIGLGVCILSISIQIFKEKKVCLLCMLIILFFFVNFAYISADFKWSTSISTIQEISTGVVFLISTIVVLIFLNNHTDSKKTLALRFNTLISEWDILHLLSSDIQNKLDRSNIILGNNEGDKIVSLFLHTACKHCLSAFRESLNLILYDDNFSIHLFIYSDNTLKDNYYFNKLFSEAQSKKYSDVYETFVDWKNAEPKQSYRIKDSQKFRQHQEILSMSKIENYPTIIFGNHKISNFAGFENIRLALLDL